MIIIDEFPQRSKEWFACKMAVPGASSFSKIITTKGELSKQATDYMYQLAGETVSGSYEESYESPWMRRGTEIEDEGIALYELVNNAAINRVALIYYDERKDRLCSPDGLRDDIDRGLEIKCPMCKTHVKYLLSGKLPTDYFQQVHGSMYITGYPEWDFVSYYPGLPMFQITVQRDDSFCEKLDKALDKFNMELYATIRKLKSIK